MRIQTHSIQEVSEILGVAVGTVRAWISDGELKAFNSSKNPKSRKPRYRVADDALRVFIESRSTAGPKPKRRSPRRARSIPQYL